MQRIHSRVLILAFLFCAILANAQTADKLLAEVQAQASAQHKNVFLIFSASWCGPCHQLDKFLQNSDMKPIVDKYFVIMHVHIDEAKKPELNTPGGDELLMKLAAKEPHTSGVPFLIFLDPAGKPIVNSDRPVPGKPVGDNIGYPVAPEEIVWFMEMLKRGAPEMPKAEAQQIESWLKKAAG
jgi:thioredoxin-related protein